MTLLDLRVSDLLEGYTAARQAEGELRHQLERHTQQAQAQYRQQVAARKAEHEQRLAVFQKNALNWLLMLLLLVAAGVLLMLLNRLFSLSAPFVLFLSLFLVAFGFLIGLVLIGRWFWLVVIAQPQPPRLPSTGAASSLLSSWYSQLRGSLPVAQVNYGDRGEHEFVREVERAVGNSHFVLHSLKQRHGEDIDVTVVGPTGIWAFEVKFWNGRISWHNGRWERTDPNNKVSQDPDQQWERAQTDIKKTLQRRMARSGVKLPGPVQVWGGVAFTHPNATYHIAPAYQERWGKIEDWKKRIRDAKQLPGWDEQVVFAVMDALLDRHHEITQGGGRRSMLHVVPKLKAQAEQRWLPAIEKR